MRAISILPPDSWDPLRETDRVLIDFDRRHRRRIVLATLAGAEVKVEEIEGNPGYYSAKFHLRPHYQLEGVNISMSLVSRLPSQRQG